MGLHVSRPVRDLLTNYTVYCSVFPGLTVYSGAKFAVEVRVALKLARFLCLSSIVSRVLSFFFLSLTLTLSIYLSHPYLSLRVNG